RRQRGAADGPDLHSGRGRRDPDPGALLSQLQHLCQCHRRRDPAYPHNSGGGLPLRRPGANRAPDQRAHTGHPGDQPRQPHRRGPLPGG
ncbi:Catabolite repression HPr, partial [Dysosmobacter welbionis]